MIIHQNKKTPVLILGGSYNAFSLTRSLGQLGIPVYLSVGMQSVSLYSKYCTKSFPVSKDADVQEFWSELLLASNNQSLHGSVIFPCNDDAVEFVANNNERLAPNYLLDDALPELHLSMLDKKQTILMAQAANIDVPRFWEYEKKEDLDKIHDDITFPLIIKPINSHLFQKLFTGKKYFYAKNREELENILNQLEDINLTMILSEMIPGPDSQLGSYYTYIDQQGAPLFHFTKKIIRRYPKNEGLACYHKTEWDEEIAALGLKFFERIGYRGLGNIEFKRDLRDGRLKIIECNPRFTAAQELLVRSGMDIGLLIYNHITGLPLPELHTYKQNLRFWHPTRDFQAFLELRRKNEITFGDWISSLMHRQVFPYFKWSDPLPSIKSFLQGVRNFISRKTGFVK